MKLPYPLAGQWVEVIGALYDLPWSNNIFWKDFDLTMAKAHVFPIQIPGEPCLSTPIDNHTYSRFDVNDPNKKLIDDGLMVSQLALDYKTDLVDVLKKRYGQNITYHPETKNFCGNRITRSATGAISLDLEKYILETVKLAGLSDAPGANAPSRSDLFHAPTDTTPSDQSIYSNLMGKVTHIAQLRYGILIEATQVYYYSHSI